MIDKYIDKHSLNFKVYYDSVKLHELKSPNIM